MNVTELKQELQKAGIESKEYSLDGICKPMSMVLLFSNAEWSVFHFDERGRILGLEKFDTEDLACKNVLNRLKYNKELMHKFNLK